MISSINQNLQSNLKVFWHEGVINIVLFLFCCAGRNLEQACSNVFLLTQV